MGVVHQQIVGSGLAGNIQALDLGLADQIHTLFGRNVADMIGAAGLLHQFQIPGDGAPFAFGADAPVAVLTGIIAVMDIAAVQEGIVLTVGHDEFVQCLGLEHSLLHFLPALDTLAVVGKGYYIGCHSFHIRKLFAFFLAGDGAVRVNADHAVPPDDIQLLFQMCLAVGDRIQIGHGANCGIAASGSSQRAGQDRLLIRKTRLSEMHMHITKAGNNNVFRRTESTQFHR